ncbi:permease for cytosine/purines, uracil, thiamine, allantoin-domain-containing protein [Aspergillus ambiguus]|uniref:permease for cytosine/purines, uracil, thiamine, allantoin-domain-containing protein n=1 Tax=Aspergillus ambiguus TaxID=176160 RepID=UPI003CCD9439
MAGIAQRRVRISWTSIHEAIKLPNSSSSLINEDLAPSAPERRTWTVWDYFAYWWSEYWSIAVWSTGSSLISLGATIRDALLVVLFANVLKVGVVLLNSRAAATYHVGYPVLARGSFGIYGAYFAILLRSLIGLIWGGVQVYYEGKFLSICLRAIFPGWSRIPNSIPKSQHIDIQTMLAFIFAFLLNLPLMMVHPINIRHLFSVKSVLVPLAALGIVCWATTANRGVSDDHLVDTSAKESKSTSVFAWEIVAQFNFIVSGASALFVSIPDLTRYSKTRRSVYGQVLGLPLAHITCSAFGIITTAAVKEMWGEAYWNPYDLLNGILDRSYTPRARAGVFFASLAFAFAALGTTVAGDMIPFAADVSSLAPRYINIIRGQFLCLFLTLAIVPWHIVATRNGFLKFLDGYGIFQGPVLGIMVADYFLVRRGNWHMSDLFSRERSRLYYYARGFNLRAFVAFVAGFLLPLPGFVGSFQHMEEGNAATHMFSLGWVLSFSTGGVVYLMICWVWRVPGWKEDQDRGFEAQASTARESMEERNYGEKGPTGDPE